MASIFNVLPKPVGNYENFNDKEEAAAKLAAKAANAFRPPVYGNRQNFIPRKVEHYGDGGAFPECHVAQYPLNMGRPGAGDNDNGTAIVATYTDENGIVQYDGILTASGGGNRKIHSKFTDLIEKKFDAEKLQRPDEEAIEANTNATLAAMNMIVSKKAAAALPVKRPDAPQTAKDHEFVRYTPKPSAIGYNPNCKQRIIRVVDVPVDPMEPPKFMHRKVPGGPPSPPVPLMRSPPRKVTAEDQKNWKIPPCISNWKNARGYTIPLDKRLAADGRGLQETVVNPKFAKIAEALYQAEGSAREEVNYRAKLRKKLQLKQKHLEEERLLERAKQIREQQARMEAGGAADGSSSSSDDSSSDSDSDSDSSDSDSDSDGRSRARKPSSKPQADKASSEPESRAEVEKRMEREAMRLERKRERERDMRREAMGKRSKLSRNSDRDVSERIALGLPTGNAQKQTQYDSRLFNQSSGMDSGFGDEAEYNVYNKALFADKKQSMYRPRGHDKEIYGTADEQYNELIKTDKFRPEKDFKGIDRSKGVKKRTQPVQYERDTTGDGAADPFGLDQLMDKTKKK